MCAIVNWGWEQFLTSFQFRHSGPWTKLSLAWVRAILIRKVNERLGDKRKFIILLWNATGRCSPSSSHLKASEAWRNKIRWRSSRAIKILQNFDAKRNNLQDAPKPLTSHGKVVLFPSTTLHNRLPAILTQSRNQATSSNRLSFFFQELCFPSYKILLRRKERGILLRSGDSYKAFENLFWFVCEASRQLRKFSFLFLRFIGLAKTKTKKKLRRKKEIRGVFL